MLTRPEKREAWSGPQQVSLSAPYLLGCCNHLWGIRTEPRLVRTIWKRMKQHFSLWLCLFMLFDTYELIEQNPGVAVLRFSQSFSDDYRFERIGVVITGRNALDWSQPNGCDRETEVKDSWTYFRERFSRRPRIHTPFFQSLRHRGYWENDISHNPFTEVHISSLTRIVEPKSISEKTWSSGHQ